MTITVTAHRRPWYLWQALAALRIAGCDADFVSIDAGYDPLVLNVCDQFDTPWLISEARLGCNGNIKQALDAAWETEDDFVLLIEDDIIVTPDALKYVKWAKDAYRRDQSVRTIGLYRQFEGEAEIDVFGVERKQFFTCWGWGTWKDRWQEISENWTTGDDSHDTSWDVVMSAGLGDRYEIVPKLSRANNIGQEKGTHRGAAWPGLTAAGFVDILNLEEYVERP